MFLRFTAKVRSPRATPRRTAGRCSAPEVLFQPGLVARWPRRVSFSPPLSYFNLDLQNSGNGSDTYLVRLTSVGGDPAFYTRVELAPGAAKTIKIPVTSYDTFEISVRSQRSGLEKKGFISVTAPRRVEDGRFRLLGRLGLGYGYPSSFSTATSLAGPLSDYAYLRFGMGYTPGGVPAGNATLSFEGGYFSVAYGPSAFACKPVWGCGLGPAIWPGDSSRTRSMPR